MPNQHTPTPRPIPPFDISKPVDLHEARCVSAARDLIGDDVQKGLDEVRRLLSLQRTAYAIESRLIEEHQARHHDTPFEERVKIWEARPDAKNASAAADVAGEAHYYAVRYVWKMPIRNLSDAIAKAQFAMENADEADDDEDFQADALHQIADFLAPQELRQAAG